MTDTTTITALRASRMVDLLELLGNDPDGITVDQIAAGLATDYNTARRTIHDLRVWLGDTGQVFLVCLPQGGNDRWLYRLTDGAQLATEGTPEAWWVKNRVDDAQTRVATVAAGLQVAVRMTDGRSLVGRRARRMALSLNRLVEDLALIDEA